MLNSQIKTISILLYLLCVTITAAQNIDIGTIGKGQALKLSGGISTNSIFYTSNQNTGREAFTYFVQGNVNVGFYQFSMPISYSYSNQGSQLDFQVPFKFNRLSLHPKYKWIQAHIGDVSMTFSPYTLSGHLFTGGGVELTPKGNFKISAMTGRFLKATEDDADARTIPAFSRYGYGLKLEYDKDKYKVGFTGFYAKDQLNSISMVPEDKGVTPKENLVLSFAGGYKLLENLQLNAEYAATAITQDLRAETIETGQGVTGLLFDNRASTEYHNALKVGFDYSFLKSSVGIAYERIDPGYQTLGAYFFNNDFENITLNTSTTFFNDKLNLAFNIGYQRDNLERQKEQATNRTVGAVNATYTASETLSLTASYSNFSTFTNARVNQFETINDDNLLDNADEQFDYTQLSQNANLSLNYIISKKANLQQNLNLNYALADVSNEQGGVVRIGDASTFHNVNASYTIGFPKRRLNVTTALNGTLNTIGREDATTWGPTLGVNKKFFENALNAGFATSYNTSQGMASQTSVANIRLNASYLYKEKHNFNVNAIQLFRTLANSTNRDLTVTFGYSYAFNIGAPKKRKRPVKNEGEPIVVKDKDIRISKPLTVSYKTFKFKGTKDDIAKTIPQLINSPSYDIIRTRKEVKVQLTALENTLNTSLNATTKAFKAASLEYLKYAHQLIERMDTYYALVFNSLKRLNEEASQYDAVLKSSYTNLLAKIERTRALNKTVNEADLQHLELKKQAYDSHVWMKNQLSTLRLEDVKNDKGVLKAFKIKYFNDISSQIMTGKTPSEIELFLEKTLVGFYHKKSKEIQD